MRKKASEAKPGEKFETKTNVARYQPIYYAGASGDFNPIHIDSEFAKMVGLGRAILHGMCTMAFTARTHVDWAGGDPAALKKIKVRFSKPVYPDDEITTSAAVTSVEGSRVRTEFAAKNQDGVEVITRAWAEIELD
ncbi:MAG: MaoC/PaaZ C-terminal domain-containing protein [Deltaproteobacteria bacterium]|nr:MaoC/PaaZ C-terminal domain-containing protein [Deltaproteobacteria bacterium]